MPKSESKNLFLKRTKKFLKIQQMKSLLQRLKKLAKRQRQKLLRRNLLNLRKINIVRRLILRRRSKSGGLTQAKLMTSSVRS